MNNPRVEIRNISASPGTGAGPNVTARLGPKNGGPSTTPPVVIAPGCSRIFTIPATQRLAIDPVA
jgi:hypothetical protein